MDNVASASSETYSPDALFANDGNIRSEKGTVPDGTDAMVRGTVMGKITLGDASAAADGGNTGNGTFTLDATTPILNGAKVGAYTVTCVAAASNGGTFRVEDPDGTVLGDVAVGSTFADDIKFAIADGGTDFVVGDKFTVTIAAGSGKIVPSLAAATDGSQVPHGILANDTLAADGADIEANIYIGGEFNSDNLTFGTGHTAASVKDGLRGKGIYIR